MLYLDVAALAQNIVNWIRERRAGPETDKSKAIGDQIGQLSVERDRIEGEINQLWIDYYTARKSARPESWWTQNKQPLTVSIVAGVIVGIPFLVLGLVLGLVIK